MVLIMENSLTVACGASERSCPFESCQDLKPRDKNAIAHSFVIPQPQPSASPQAEPRMAW
jgi:hypothetical protein